MNEDYVRRWQRSWTKKQRGQEMVVQAPSFPKPPADPPPLPWAGGRHQPKRDDDVARWLKEWRDRFPKGEECPEVDIAHLTIDAMLDDYRARADCGATMQESPWWT